VRDIKSSGFDVVSTANNHAMDRRAPGGDATIDELNAIGIKFAGTRKSTDGAGTYHTIVEKKGWRVAFIACTFSTNGMPDRFKQVLMCYENRDVLLGAIRELAARSDVNAVIVTPHWGEEYSPAPAQKDILLGRAMIDAGATSVIGTHPHVVQTWERYVTPGGREALIAYSTGNFVSAQQEWEKRCEAAIFLGLSRDSASGKAYVHGVSYLPMFMQRAPNGRYKLSALPRAQQYQHQWAHFASLFGNDRLLLQSMHLDTCATQAPSPDAPVPDAPAPRVSPQSVDTPVLAAAE
jgi:hypothetical protein